jgi:lysophospholipase L1-like esterase
LTTAPAPSSYLRLIASRFPLILLGVLLPFFILEAGLRFDVWRRKGVPLTLNPRDRWDPTLGWTGTEHVLGSKDTPLGILAIGDSFTEGLTVPGSEMWFAHLQTLYPDTHTVAYGALGYGTLQQLMVLDRYLSQVKPKLIVLQMCSNDIINNYLPLEKLSYRQRAPAPRPYLVNGSSQIAFARPYDWLLVPFMSYSRFVSRQSVNWERSVLQRVDSGQLVSVESTIERDGFGFPPFREAVGLTTELLKRIRDRAGDVPLVLFLVDDLQPYTNAIRGSARKLGMRLLLPFHDFKIPSEARLPDGAHLNKEGNALLGARLLTAIQASQSPPT